MNSKSGWILLHRKIRTHWIWSNELYLKIWVDFLLRANFENNKILLGQNIAVNRRGQFITSLKKLSSNYKCSVSKIRHFLKLLEKDSMIILKTTPKYTQITICNYSTYQDSQQIERNQKEIKRQTEINQKNTEKEIERKRNNSKEKKEKRTEVNSTYNSKSFGEKSIQYQLSLLLYSLRNKTATNNPKPNFQNWASIFDIMISKDKTSNEVISEAVFFSQENSFWKNIIKDPNSLRKNLSAILKQMDIS